jgi:hypothetical protein
MQSENPDLKEATMYKKYSCFIALVSFPFGLMGFILRDSSSFAIDMMSYGIVGLFIGLISLFFWNRKLRTLRKQIE